MELKSFEKLFLDECELRNKQYYPNDHQQATIDQLAEHLRAGLSERSALDTKGISSFLYAVALMDYLVTDVGLKASEATLCLGVALVRTLRSIDTVEEFQEIMKSIGDANG